ncbi:MAG: hypothetical protein MAG453_00123 [Calditrichaeota bacterium]|nr:hypothetical protein [Calditrichota bacterium]
MHDHRHLRAFELADELVFLVYDITGRFPEKEKFGLTSQMRRAALSVPSNIVEGCARETDKEFLRFMHYAYGSLREVEYQLSVARRLNYAENEGTQKIKTHISETAQVLYGLMRKIRNLQQ